MNTPDPLQQNDPFMEAPKVDALTDSENKQKELQKECAAMRDDSVERKKAPIGRFELAQHRRNVWRFVLPEGDTLDDALETDYWIHVSQRLTSLDTIEIVPDDGSFYAELLVRSLAFGQVSTGVIRLVKFNEVGESFQAIESQYTVKFKGPHEKWVVLSANGEVLVTKLDNEGVAHRWLNNYVKKQIA